MRLILCLCRDSPLSKIFRLVLHYVRRPSSLAYLLMWQFVTTQTKLWKLLGALESPWNWKIHWSQKSWFNLPNSYLEGFLSSGLTIFSSLLMENVFQVIKYPNKFISSVWSFIGTKMLKFFANINFKNWIWQDFLDNY